jgi:hypothetical protein
MNQPENDEPALRNDEPALRMMNQSTINQPENEKLRYDEPI